VIERKHDAGVKAAPARLSNAPECGLDDAIFMPCIGAAATSAETIVASLGTMPHCSMLAAMNSRKRKDRYSMPMAQRSPQSIASNQ